MGKLFGTDGIRGVANQTLTCELAYRMGQAVAISLSKETHSVPTVVIGKDTRISSDMLEYALLAGLCASGCNAISLGVIPTPAVAYLTVYHHADAGIVISASHNPYEYNGIKMFSAEGFKLNDALEEEIEELILSGENLAVKTHGELGRVIDGRESTEAYIRHLVSTVGRLSGLRILVDCANGASSATAGRLFSHFDLIVDVINNSPDGININDHCGSTHLSGLADLVRRGGYDLGIAFDGDADRCLVVDEQGNEVDGDKIMAICARSMRGKGTLKNDGFVATVMSNLGLHKYCGENGLKLLCAAVGDRNVLEMMQKEDMRLGGEQSGHIIFLDHMTTGDGQLAALQFLQILCESKLPVSKLAGDISRYPQVLINVAGPHDNAAKKELIESEALRISVKEGDAMLAGDGRILLRASGTEALIRVMVEASTQEMAQKVAEHIAEAVKNAQKNRLNLESL